MEKPSVFNVDHLNSIPKSMKKWHFFLFLGIVFLVVLIVSIFIYLAISEKLIFKKYKRTKTVLNLEPLSDAVPVPLTQEATAKRDRVISTALNT